MPAVETEPKVVNANIADWVLWYELGDSNQKPSAALVTDTDGKGCLQLCVWPPNAAVPKLVSGARHVNSSIAAENEHVRHDCGTWKHRHK